MSFKGVSPRKKWQNPKKIEILTFQGTMKGSLIKLYQYEQCAKIWVLMEIFTFW